MTVILTMELEFRRPAPARVSPLDHTSLMNVAAVLGRRGFAKLLGIGSDAMGSVRVETSK